ncbi:hypothetical protein Taro_007293 [Colocasia esculenta]|uniref:ALOG domain-containing protein n=1 Tax=Colocasia esculenta TaxID=4460 RepID=A0A843TV29_COLES|nr:hypothetical protein [Colocasia esculenta]
MEANPDASGSGEGPSSSPSAASAAGAASSSDQPPPPAPPLPAAAGAPSQQQQQPLSRYESQKRRDWNTFLQYLRNHKPPLSLSRCSGAHVIEFLKYLDQFGKTKVHVAGCAYFGHPNPPASCACPLKQAWGSLDALIGRLRAAYEENGGRPESNPFGARAVGIYLREVRASQAKARGIPYEKKKRKRPGAGTAGPSAQAGAASGSDPTPPSSSAGTSTPGAPADTTAGAKPLADGTGGAAASSSAATEGLTRAPPGGSSTS